MKFRLFESAQADGGAGGGGESAEADAASTEQEARDMGWQPKEMWKGDQKHWIDAAEFVKRGKNFIPFLQADRRKLRDDLSATNTKLTSVQAQLADTQAQLREITEFNQQMAADRDTRKKSELGAAIKTEEDPVKKAEMETELREITDRERTRGKEKPSERQAPPSSQQTVQIQPWVQNYIDSNQEFFSDQDRVLLFNAEMARRRQAGDRRVGDVDGTALFNEAKEAVERKFGGNQHRRAAPKTEESRPVRRSGGNGSDGGKSFFDLPADAQAKCDEQERKFVGEKKQFKTRDDWRRHYVTEYFG